MNNNYEEQIPSNLQSLERYLTFQISKVKSLIMISENTIERSSDSYHNCKTPSQKEEMYSLQQKEESVLSNLQFRLDWLNTQYESVFNEMNKEGVEIFREEDNNDNQ